MAKIYITPLTIPEGVSVTISEQHIHIKKDDISMDHFIHDGSICEIKDNMLFFDVSTGSKTHKRFTSTLYANVKNSLSGLVTPFEKSLKLVGVGFKAVVYKDEGNIEFSINLSHPLVYKIPQYIYAENQGPTILKLHSHDKHLLGKVCAHIKSFRIPDAYKGKGIRYLNENIVLKTIKKR